MKLNRWVFLLLSLLTVSTYADPPLPTPIGRVVWIKGELKAVMPNKEVRSLQKLSLIYLHDTLLTDNRSQAEIAFTDNSLMTFRPNSKFYIDQYSFNPGNKKTSGKYVMNLVEGGFRTITGLIAKKDPSSYQVKTPVATIGVRGTDYTVYIHNNQIYMGYYSGSPCVSSGASSLCLNSKTPYLFVPTPGTIQPLTQQPDVFKEKLQITQAKIAPFQPSTTNGVGGPHGSISSFCISQ